MDPRHDPTALGTLVQIWAGLSRDLLQKALDLQAQEPRLRLGQALERLALLDRAKVGEMLALQLRLRRGRVKDSDVRALLSFAARQTRDNARVLHKLLSR